MRIPSLLLLPLLAACSNDTPAPTQTPAEVPAATPAPMDHTMHTTQAPAGDMETPPAGARVFFTEPADGATVPAQFKAVFGLEGMGVVAAGEIKPGTGHHHVLVDMDAMPAGEVIPKDEKHLHFGDGATEATITLPPGDHTLTLQFADGAHRSFGPSMASTIKVKVQ